VKALSLILTVFVLAIPLQICAQTAVPNHTVTIGSPFVSGGFGTRILGMRDYNSDGFEDYVVTAPSAPFATGIGLARVYSGRTSALLAEAFGDQTNSRFGYGVADVGDANADGVPDFAIGAPHHDLAANNGGRVFLFSGSTGAVIWTYEGVSNFGELGETLATVLDLTGDGVADLAVSQPGFGSTGRVVFLNSANGTVIGVTDGPVGAIRMSRSLVARGGAIYAGDETGKVFIVSTPSAGVGTATLFTPTPPGASATPQLAILANPIAGFDLIVGRSFTDVPITNAGSVDLYVGGNPLSALTITGSYTSEGIGVRVSDIRDYNGDGEEDILYLSGFSGAVGVGRVRIVSRLGVTLLDTTLTGATVRHPGMAFIPVCPFVFRRYCTDRFSCVDSIRNSSRIAHVDELQVCAGVRRGFAARYPALRRRH
jgi:hypothetical protein